MFIIVIKKSPESDLWKACPPYLDIGMVSPYPEGLAVLKPGESGYRKGALSKWLTKDGKPGPSNFNATEPIIDTSGMMAGDLFYCHEGKWLTMSVD